MADLSDVLDTVQREVKRFGDDVTALERSLKRDLADVRDMAEKAGRAAVSNPEIKKDLDAITAGIAEKHAALQAQVKSMEDGATSVASRMDDLERKLNRGRLSGGPGSDDEFKAAHQFFATKAAIRKELKPGDKLSDAAVNVDEYKAYDAAFSHAISNRQGEHGLSSDERKAMSVGSDPDGGYLVPSATSNRIMTIVRESSPLRRLATIENISGPDLKIPIDEDEADAGWVGETEGRPETGTPKGGTQTIPAYELYAQPKATQQFIEDAGIDVAAWLGRKVGEKFARVEATSFFLGNGVKKPRGILTYPAGTTRGTIEQIVSGGATSIAFDGIINLITALKGPYKTGAAFMMKRTTVGAVMLLKDTTGQYLWRPNNQVGQPSLLLGYPVEEAEDQPAVAAGALAMSFGDFKAAYTILDRLGISVLVDPYTAKPFVSYYTRKRVGGDVTNFEALKLMKIST